MLTGLPSKMQASTPLSALKGIGPNLMVLLAKLHIRSVQDLWFHLPLRYLNRTRLIPINQLRLNTSAVIQGRVVKNQIALGRRRSLVITLDDGSGHIVLRFFHFNAAQKQQMEEGVYLRCFGDPRLGLSGLEFYHPEYQVIVSDEPPPLDQSLTPIYGCTEGLSQQRLRKLIAQSLAWMQQNPPEDLLPMAELPQFGNVSLVQALNYVHCPPLEAPVDALMAGVHPFQQRLAFEELLAHHLTLQQSRQLAHLEPAPVLVSDPQRMSVFYERLPYRLTQAQLRVIAHIHADLSKNKPMLRLVQGDVGCGKTLVAVAAALVVLAQGWQVAVVAPTEILAEQHLAQFIQWLEPLGYGVGRLLGKMTLKQKQQTLEQLLSGQIQLVIGTHALMEDSVAFSKLGLIIIDEQHRFGVHQRLALRHKSRDTTLMPHQLIMTATPIPRTLAMTAYADLDVSVIDEMPPGRSPVNTLLVSQQRREEIIQRVSQACREGRQAYWVCTLVEDSETLAAAAAEATANLLKESLPDIPIGLVHGRLKAREKEAVMSEFKTAQLKLLVATTVIEVGVDVPNASLMIIENPERLGLAQLHQLRGRVGRGSQQSHCVLLYAQPLSQLARQRLHILKETQDGFAIAEEDLKIRGPGELLGTRQTGDLQFRVANLQRDGHLLEAVHRVAQIFITQNSETGTKIINRWFCEQRHYIKG